MSDRVLNALDWYFESRALAVALSLALVFSLTMAVAQTMSAAQPTITLLDDDRHDIGITCTASSTAYVGTHLIVHGVGCQADRIFADGVE